MTFGHYHHRVVTRKRKFKPKFSLMNSFVWSREKDGMMRHVMMLLRSPWDGQSWDPSDSPPAGPVPATSILSIPSPPWPSAPYPHPSVPSPVAMPTHLSASNPSHLPLPCFSPWQCFLPPPVPSVAMRPSPRQRRLLVQWGGGASSLDGPSNF
jgi:hypothetical protein